MGFWDDVNKNADKMWEFDQITGNRYINSRNRKGWGKYKHTIFENDRIYKAFMIGLVIIVVFIYVCKLVY